MTALTVVRIFILLCLVGLAGCSDDRRQLCAQPDITAYELATLLYYQNDIDRALLENPALNRHVAKIGECKKP